MKKAALAILAILVLAASSNAQQMINAKISKIIDGNTIEISSPKMRVKLYGADAPELGQPYGKEAQELLNMLVGNKMATINMVTKDVGIVYVDEYEIGYHLISLGYAWVDKSDLNKSDVSRFLYAEKGAREQKKGLWKDPSAMPPWEWMKTKKK